MHTQPRRNRRLHTPHRHLWAPDEPVLAMTLAPLPPRTPYALVELPKSEKYPLGGYAFVLRDESAADEIAGSYAATLTGEPKRLLTRALRIDPADIGEGTGWWGDGDAPVHPAVIEFLEASGRMVPWPHKYR